MFAILDFVENFRKIHEFLHHNETHHGTETPWYDVYGNAGEPPAFRQKFH